MTETKLCCLLETVPFGIHEIMMHPGCKAKELGKVFKWGYRWESELKALLSERVRAIAEKKNIAFINYGDLL